VSCYRPINAEQSPDGRILLWSKGNGRALELPCGRCIGCKLSRARMWAIRIKHEASMFSANWFLTLTYDDEHLPKSLSLEYKDIQLFLKRLRLKYKGYEPGPSGTAPVRFFVAGEYGEQYQRPHWHMMLFNVKFPDLAPFVDNTWQSRAVEALWGKGNVVIGSVTIQSAAYVAGYSLKKVHGAGAGCHYEDVATERLGT